jgi:hypothetical protein
VRDVVDSKPQPKSGSTALQREAFAARLKPFQSPDAQTNNVEQASTPQATPQPKTTPRTDIRQRWKPDGADGADFAHKGQPPAPGQAVQRMKPLPSVFEQNKQTAELQSKHNTRNGGKDLAQSKDNSGWKR